MSRRPLTLRATLLVAYAAGMCVVLGAIASVAQGLYWRSLVADLDRDLLTQARAVARSIALDADDQVEILVPPEVRAFLVDQPDAYYVVRHADGRTLDFTAPDLEVPPLAPGETRTRGRRHEVAVAGGLDTVVIVGRSLAVQQQSYRTFVTTLAVAGVAGVLVAVASGWWLIRRLMAPIERISRTAEAMSATNLGLRIDVGETASELGDVARAINGAFDRLQAAFEQQSRFTADASHELRTPLSTVVSEAEWALRRDREPGDYQRAFTVALRAARRMQEVVETMLRLARADAATLAPVRAPVNLRDVIEEVVAGLRTMASSRSVTVDTQLAPAELIGDRQRLRDAIDNVVMNAIQYNRPHGHVRIAVSSRHDRHIVEVEDSGIGIAPPDVPHVFERFYRADATRSREVGGSGLGLAIAQAIVRQHGGDITCRSRLGSGSTFAIELPLRGPSEGPAPSGATPRG